MADPSIRPRVLRVSGGLHPTVGGPFASTVGSCAAWISRGHPLTLAHPDFGASASVSKQLRALGVAEYTFPLRWRRWSVSGPMQLWLLRRSREFDVIHAHGAWTATTITALIAAKVNRRVAALTPHESLCSFDIAKSSLGVRILKRALRRIYLRAFDLIVFASAWELRESGALGSPRAVVVPHPVETRARGARKGRNGDAPTIGFLGRFDRKKNLSLVIRSLPAGCRLVVAGSGSVEAEASLRALTKETGCVDRVTWLGFVDENGKEDFFSAIDVLTMPSTFESFGMAAAEALAAGIPVIVGSDTGIADIVREDRCGWVVEPDRESLAEVLENLGDLDTRAAAARGAARRFSLAAHGLGLERAYAMVTSTSHMRQSHV